MLALVALAVACTSLALAHDNSTSFSRDALDRTLSFVFGEQDARWPRRVASCSRALGPAKCINAFSVWRADNAIEAYRNYGGYRSVVVDDLNQFPWEEFANVTDEQLGEELSDSTAKLLQLRSLQTSVLPGYRLLLNVKNDALNVDIYKNDDEKGEARGTMKKLRKKFYAIVPLLLIPGLVMAAIFPFILPALKMSVIGAGMLNQMALTGAIFTLLRNNAFNDYYEKKVIYVNKGYKNEKRRPVHIEEEIHSHSVDDGFYEDDGAWRQGPEITEYAASHDYPVVAEAPVNADWINQYYGGEGFSHIESHPVDREYDTKRRRKTKLKHRD